MPAPAAGAVSLGAVRPAQQDDRAQAIEEFRTGRATPGGPRPLASTGYVDLMRVRPDGMFIANRAPQTDDEKRALLEAEGVAFLPDGRVDMARHQWTGEDETL